MPQLDLQILDGATELPLCLTFAFTEGPPERIPEGKVAFLLLMSEDRAQKSVVYFTMDEMIAFFEAVWLLRATAESYARRS